jgi:hypothetical protein
MVGDYQRKYWQAPSFWLLCGVALGVPSVAAWFWLDFFWSSQTLGTLSLDLQAWCPFAQQVQNGRVPYVDFSRGYPPAAGVIFWLLSLLASCRHWYAFVRNHCLLMSCFEALNVMLLFFVLRGEKARHPAGWACLYALLPTSFIVGPFRYEHVVVTTVLLGLLFYQRSRPAWAFCFWALGAALKFYPAVIIAAAAMDLIFVAGRRASWLKYGAIIGGVLVVLNLPFLAGSLLAKGQAWPFLIPYQTHFVRPLYFDTVFGALALWFGPLRLEPYAAVMSLGLVLLALVLKPELGLVRKSAIALMAAFIFNRAHSSQFHLWFYPFIVISAAQVSAGSARRILAALLLIETAHICLYPFLFPYLMDEIGLFNFYQAHWQGGLAAEMFTGLVFYRSVMLAAMIAVLLRTKAAAGVKLKHERALVRLQRTCIAAVVLLLAAVAARAACNGAFAVPGMIEAEQMEIVRKRPDLMFRYQYVNRTGERAWSHDGYMVGPEARADDSVLLSFGGLPRPGSYEVFAYLLKGPAGCRVAPSLNARSSAEIDLRSAERTTSSGPVKLGVYDLNASGNLLGLRVIGPIPGGAATCQLGIDGVVPKAVR